MKVNNEIYNSYGERWYTAFDDPVALLRAESLVKKSWITEVLKDLKYHSPNSKILDVGCGAGFLTNALALENLDMTGIDASSESLEIAKRHDRTNSVKYFVADAYHLPFPDRHFDVVTALDFLEHVERPLEVIQEISRVLKPRGLFFFHTFNRNWLSHLIIIKMVEWFVKNTPKNMHVIDLFIKPSEIKSYCLLSKMETKKIVGIKPVFSSLQFNSLFTGIVPTQFRFEITQNLMLSYLGYAVKQGSP